MDLLIIIFAAALSLGGFWGGLWFWKKMAESPDWEKVRKKLKIAGCGGAPALFAVVISVIWINTEPPEFSSRYISCIILGPWFVLFYMLGFDASILLPESKEMKARHRNEKIGSKFQINWNLLKKELFASITAIASGLALFLVSWITIQILEMWIAGVAGFAIAFFIWEYIKETGMITGAFKRWLVLLSLITTAVIGGIAGYGIHVDFSGANPCSVRRLLVSMILFFDCIAWYMLALAIVAFRASKAKPAFRNGRRNAR